MNKKLIKNDSYIKIRNYINKIVKEEIKKIKEEKIKKSWSDYSSIHKIPNFDNPLSIQMNSLTEGLIKTYPIDKTIQYVKDYFHLSDWQISKENYNGIERIIVRIPNIFTNVQLIEKAFDLCGYFLGYPRKEDLRKNEIVDLQFEPKIQENISNELRKNEETLIHITPFYNIKKITKIGLSPKYKNTLFNFPNRIYFVKGSTNESKIMELARQLHEKNNSIANDGRYVILTLHLGSIPNNIEFFEDPNYTNGVYTNQFLNKESIIDIKEIQL